MEIIKKFLFHKFRAFGVFALLGLSFVIFLYVKQYTIPDVQLPGYLYPNLRAEYSHVFWSAMFIYTISIVVPFLVISVCVWIAVTSRPFQWKRTGWLVFASAIGVFIACFFAQDNVSMFRYLLFHEKQTVSISDPHLHETTYHSSSKSTFNTTSYYISGSNLSSNKQIDEATYAFIRDRIYTSSDPNETPNNTVILTIPNGSHSFNPTVNAVVLNKYEKTIPASESSSVMNWIIGILTIIGLTLFGIFRLLIRLIVFLIQNIQKK